MVEDRFFSLRVEMVKNQIIARGIKDERVIKAFLRIPRHNFVLENNLSEAYNDYPLPIGEGQTISQPYMVALMTECLRLKGEERVMEIGTGSGYQTAILAELAQEVYSIERFPSLAERAKVILEGLGYKNIKIKVGDGTLGWEEFSPYAGIMVTAGAPEVPPPLIAQLKEGGRLVIPLGESFSQVLTVIEKIGNKIRREEICGCVFVPLVGKYGWHS
ncbi:MAG: protein-L-isoaspartate(D-aspartate) O-methyltransferase [Candidatus Omnitrophica bacterium]|nr:protein-L-isoaspartate(D-aspartate) O-methyltransferase [Candidatus Omnitrophota bacterium]MCM8793872.1 protein-L-isoaspartate(D-aspartate) O-methyltransferase [Candidatus Omnitrophota bacterium]